jgi:hypothetical protein
MTVGPKEFETARAIYVWMNKGGRALIFGTGREYGSVYPDLRPQGERINPVYLSADGNLWLQFGPLEGKPVFGPLEKRRELMNRLGAIEGAGLSEPDLRSVRALSLKKVAADPNGLSKLISALDWMDIQIAQSVGST